MSNHTPGPWVAQGHKVYGPSHHESKHPNGRVFIAEVAQGTHRAVPGLNGGEDRFGFDSKADVRVIVAAPRMLEALEWLSNEFDCRADEYGVLFTHSDFAKVRDVLQKVRDA